MRVVQTLQSNMSQECFASPNLREVEVANQILNIEGDLLVPTIQISFEYSSDQT
jgi:hypothetical protein